ncbi:peptidase domain-containing ABC transporter [uncultured Flavobacterium sp.]|uniref:peptidase domain-containing ABC transporter n=1 Tax=uncultured Flavobacterium sp. TaxID=165435 RepID=UPI002591E9FF|nr:peptidase domain-containing ABC transporter [uncultured Flavobacterium sp.]
MIFIPQHDSMDCGPACLAMAASAYKKKYSLQYLRDNSFITREGVSLLGISEAAHKIGFQTVSAEVTIEKLNKMPTPSILHWNQNHFVVLNKIEYRRNYFFFGKYRWKFKIADPAYGFINVNKENFEKAWLTDNCRGVALFLEPTSEFYQKPTQESQKLNLRYILGYLNPFKNQLASLFLTLLFGSGLTFVFPFLTQNLIDKGVAHKDLGYIGLILLAQLGIFLGSITIEIIRNAITLVVGTRISITIISDFLKKILQLPLKFFDSKMIGDFYQRIHDNERIEHFLTSQSLITFFSMIAFSTFFGVLWYYDIKILSVYLLLTILSLIWSSYWLKKRKILDYFSFQQRSENQEAIYEIINGVSEMKLNQFEDLKRKNWEEIQQKLFKTNIRILKLDQFQLSGFEFLNQLKNILVTFLAASYVVNGTMTLGQLLSVSYIIGQMNAPVNQLVAFFRSLQDAKISLERLNEVQNHAKEELNNHVMLETTSSNNNVESGIRFENAHFQYEGPQSPYILKDINLFIPEGKITAIVGSSGSGKTTLMKLLLRFYDLTGGSLFYNSNNINDISPKSLRLNCGVVMQEGYIFSDTIERNIATGDENVDMEKLKKAVRIASIEDFIESLPLKYNTKIGASGNGISGGQKQRILIARAVYKNPHYIFFDEATSALDAENEKIIHDNLQEFFKDKTVVIIAHRLSTVKSADNIVVLKDGEIVEKGSHSELVYNKGGYFNLVKNQLELGN